MNIPQIALDTFFWLIGATIGVGMYIFTGILILTLIEGFKWLIEDERNKRR